MSRLYLLLFLVMPVAELSLLISVGKAIGVLPTVALLLLTAVAGVALLQYQGFMTLRKLQERLAMGELPDQELLEGALLLVGGLFLLIPGFISDAVAFVCLVPFSRHFICRSILNKQLLRPYVKHPATDDAGFDVPFSANHKTRPQIIEGEFKRTDAE